MRPPPPGPGPGRDTRGGMWVLARLCACDAALQDESKSHIKTLVGILAMQGGEITYQASELEELQDIVARYEESASAPWLTRLRGLLGELLQ